MLASHSADGIEDSGVSELLRMSLWVYVKRWMQTYALEYAHG